MAAIGTTWGTGTWADDVWGTGTWGDATVINVIDTALERISIVNIMMPFRHIGVSEDYTGFHVGKRQGAALLYGGSWSLQYGWGIEASKLTEAVELEALI